MSDCNLVDIVDFADTCAASNPYWKMSATDRDLFGTYAQQKLQAQRPATIVEQKYTVDKKDDGDQLDSLLDTADTANADESGDDGGDTNNDARECDTKSADAMVSANGEVIAPTPDTKGRRKSQRWIEYCSEARKDFLAEGITKPDSKAVHQRAREYLSQDGWI